MKKNIYIASILILSFNALKAQEVIKLYPNGPKESNQIATPEKYRDQEFLMDISEPRMIAFPAAKDKANGTAVVICPGGGYAGVSIIKEGSEFAKWFNDLGVSAFVLYYRMPNGHTTIPLTDARTALKIVRDRATEWNIDKTKIGIMGFSAGGHLASTLGTHFKSKIQRPDFMILAYPVVTMEKELTHAGSRENLLGKNPTDKQVKYFSNELRVTKKTPPTFIVHAKDDTTVPVANSRQLLKALQDKGVPAELHTFEVGGHGFGMRPKGIPVDYWPDLLKTWLTNRKLIKVD